MIECTIKIRLKADNAPSDTETIQHTLAKIVLFGTGNECRDPSNPATKIAHALLRGIREIQCRTTEEHTS